MKNFKIIIPILIMILMSSSTVLADSEIKPEEVLKSGGNLNKETSQALQQTLDRITGELKVPGLQVSITKGDKVWSGVAGSVDRKGKESLEKDHILRIGSLTKIYTATVILKLEEEGLLNFDDKLSKWYPDFVGADKITVDYLLKHRTGIYNYSGNIWFYLKSVFSSEREFKAEEVMEIAAKRELKFEPGTEYSYSNTNYLLLGLIAEQVSGESMARLYDKYIFTPLCLNNTHFVPYETVPEKMIAGYDGDVIPLITNKIKPENKTWPTGAFTAGAVSSNANDLVIFMENIFNNNLLSNESLRKMTDFQSGPGFEKSNMSGYGYGIFKMKLNKDILWGHNGSIIGYGAAVFYCPEKDYIIAVTGNYSMLDAIAIVEQFQKAIAKI